MGLKKFISENIVDVGGEKHEEPAKVAAKPKTPIVFHDSEISATSSGYYDAPPIGAVDNSEFVKHFHDLIQKNNQPGNDYIELKAAKDAMTSLPDEAQRYKIAFAGLSAAGLTVDSLDKSAAFYISLIKSEQQQFKAAFDAQFQAQVSAKKDQVIQKQQQMAAMAEKINALNAEIKATQEQIDSDSASLTAKGSGFNSAAEQVITEIQSELEKFHSYI